MYMIYMYHIYIMYIFLFFFVYSGVCLWERERERERERALIARYEEGGSYPKPGSWANCDEFAPQYQFFPRYGGANSSQLLLAQLLGFGYDPRLFLKPSEQGCFGTCHRTSNGHGGMFQNSPVRKILGTVLGVAKHAT